MWSRLVSHSVSKPDLFVCYANFIDGLKMKAINLNTHENMHTHLKIIWDYVFCCNQPTFFEAMSHIWWWKIQHHLIVFCSCFFSIIIQTECSVNYFLHQKHYWTLKIEREMRWTLVILAIVRPYIFTHRHTLAIPIIFSLNIFLQISNFRFIQYKN